LKDVSGPVYLLPGNHDPLNPAYGIVDSLSPDPDDPSLIFLQTVEKTIAEGKIQYLALGDRHTRLITVSTRSGCLQIRPMQMES
jgi:hypothetical protein